MQHERTHPTLCLAARFIAAALLANVFYSCTPEEDLISPSELGRWTTYNVKSSDLADNYVSALFEDSENNIWIGTGDGLNKFDRKEFETYTTDDGLLDNAINCITQDKEGRIWTGGRYGINVLVDDEWLYFVAFEGMEVNALLRLENGDILIGTNPGGVYRYRASSKAFSQYYFDPSCAACNDVHAFHESANGNIWIGTYGGVKRLVGNTVHSYTVASGLPSDSIYSFGEDSWGDVWIGTINASTIGRFSDKEISSVDLGNGFARNWVGSIREDINGRLWIGTVGNYLVQYDGVVMHTPADFTGRSALSMIRDHSGVMWVGTVSRGLMTYQPAPEKK